MEEYDIMCVFLFYYFCTRIAGAGTGEVHLVIMSYGLNTCSSSNSFLDDAFATGICYLSRGISCVRKVWWGSG